MGDGFWSWVWVVLGLLVDWMGLLMCWVYLPWVMGLLAMGRVEFASFLVFFFLVVVGLMSVGVVGFVIDGGGDGD